MPCYKCKKKGLPIPCSYCNHGYCSGCIQLEIHKCEGLADKIENEKTNLEKKLCIEVKKKCELSY